MSEEKVSYREIMKATSLFGGVQVFNIIVALIKSKIIAVFWDRQEWGFSVC